MTRIARFLILASMTAAFSAIPVAAQAVNVDYDHTVNFEKLKTYTWGKIHATNPSVENRITIAVNRTMAARYMSQASSNADVTITAVEASGEPKEFTDFYSSIGDFMWKRPWGSAGFMDSNATLETIPLHTLVIDLYDTKSYKLLWRGTVTLPAGDATGKEADQKFDKAVTQLIGKYPPKFKK